VSSDLGLGHHGLAATKVSALAGSVFGQTPEQGAESSLVAATTDLPGGSYLGPDGLGGNRGRPTLLGRSFEASDPDLGRRLWEWSERQVSGWGQMQADAGGSG